MMTIKQQRPDVLFFFFAFHHQLVSSKGLSSVGAQRVLQKSKTRLDITIGTKKSEEQRTAFPCCAYLRQKKVLLPHVMAAIFREDWYDPTKPRKPATEAQLEREREEKLRAAAQEEKSLASLQTCCKYLIPGLAIVATLVALVAVIGTSGSQVSEGTPRAAIIVLEGMKGTVFDALMSNSKLPNIQYLAAQGTRSMCSSLSDSRCGRTQSGQLLGSQYMWTSGPGLASILTGVNADKHRVTNDTFNAYTQFTLTTQTYPSFLSVAKKAGLSTQIIGASHLVTSTTSAGGSCSLLGIADFECGTDAAGRCLQSSTCNVDRRVATLPVNDFAGTEEVALNNLLAAAFTSTSFNSDITVLHANKLARLAEDPSFPDFFYSADSVDYAAEAYVLDSVVGQLMAYITDRVVHTKENWMVILTSDRGGLGKSSGTNTDDDEVIPFVVATMTTSGNLVLNPLTLPTTQMDVAPTVLAWFGLTAPTTVDGRVQGVCSSGRFPADCSASAGGL